ncbi:hypothetical protein E6O75_ATG09933 [Venturia nashicola]|uniref:Uncharacterized protein n=1 Tax=Venturia nashicola TaxID=86259 RepID=A0A4Z1P0R9_9PEZI|nr:hypothetical protein E6O75_ATG09933 [Venturia nashicola]
MNMNTSKAKVPTAPRTSENTWRYNDSDSDSDNDNAGDEEGIFTLFAARAREFEAGDPVPRRRIRGPSAENTGNADEVPNSLMAAGSARPGTPQVGDERRLANDYMGERWVASEGVTERQQEAGSVLERPGNAYLPRETVGTF